MPEGKSKIIVQLSQTVLTFTLTLNSIYFSATDLSIKLEVGREEEVAGVMMSGKQRSFSMDLSPSEPLFGGGLGSVPSNSWSLPSPSSGSGQQSLHHPQSSPPNAQTTADGKSKKLS